MKFNIKITKDAFAKAYKHALEETIAKTTIKGFRKGHAPANLVLKQVGESGVIEHALQHALPDAYIKHVTDNKLEPISSPKFTPVSTEKDSDWEFAVEVAERPEVKLGDYKKAIKGLSAAAKIWTPEKGDAKAEPEKSKQQTEAETLNKIFETLLKIAKLEVSQLLIDEEVNQMLVSLMEQVGKIGMRVEDYLKAKNTTIDDIKKTYTQQAEDNLKLEFILQEITKSENIEVTDAEIETLLKDVTDLEAKKKLQTPEETSRIKSVLRRRKTIDRLITLSV